MKNIFVITLLLSVLFASAQQNKVTVINNYFPKYQLTYGAQVDASAVFKSKKAIMYRVYIGQDMRLWTSVNEYYVTPTIYSTCAGVSAGHYFKLLHTSVFLGGGVNYENELVSNVNNTYMRQVVSFQNIKRTKPYAFAGIEYSRKIFGPLSLTAGVTGKIRVEDGYYYWSHDTGQDTYRFNSYNTIKLFILQPSLGLQIRL